MFLMVIRKAILFPKLLSWLVFIRETEFDFRDVETEYLYTICMIFVSKGLQQHAKNATIVHLQCGQRPNFRNTKQSDMKFDY